MLLLYKVQFQAGLLCLEQTKLLHIVVRSLAPIYKEA